MKGMKCIRCGKIAKSAKLRFQGIHIDGWRCKCGEDYFDPEQAQRILSINKIRNETFKVKVGRIKSNLILRIPKAVSEAVGIKEGERIAIKVKNSKEIRLIAS